MYFKQCSACDKNAFWKISFQICRGFKHFSAINRVLVCPPVYLCYCNNIKTSSDLLSLRISNGSVWNFSPLTLWPTNRWLCWFSGGCCSGQTMWFLQFSPGVCVSARVHVPPCGAGCTDSAPLSPQLRALQCRVLRRGGSQVSHSRLSLWSLLQVSYLSHGV